MATVAFLGIILISDTVQRWLSGPHSFHPERPWPVAPLLFLPLGGGMGGPQRFGNLPEVTQHGGKPWQPAPHPCSATWPQRP